MVPEYALWSLGRSVQDRALDALAVAPFGGSGCLAPVPTVASWPWVLCLGAAHGDELEGVWLLEEMRGRWTRDFGFRNVGVILWAQVNPDGVALGQRWNARNVDLNRNLPTRDWTAEVKNPRYPPGGSPASEPESKALIKLIEACRPAAILSLHSFSRYQVNSNGPARAWADRIAEVCGYPVTEDIGYPTPGSLGTYAGAELRIPTVTLEIERGLVKDKVLALHIPVLEAAIEFWNKESKT